MAGWAAKLYSLPKDLLSDEVKAKIFIALQEKDWDDARCTKFFNDSEALGSQNLVGILKALLPAKGDEVHLETGMESEARWYVLDQSQEYQGPYTLTELQDHYASGHLTESSLLWADGKTDWYPLALIDELNMPVITQNPHVQDLQRNRVRQHGASGKNGDVGSSGGKEEESLSAGDDDDFRRWQQEIKKAEEEAAALKAGRGNKGENNTSSVDTGAGENEDGVSNDEERPHTPPEGEEEFTDDDGTVYRWDHKLRAWVPQGESFIEVPHYGAEEMTYVQEEELIPTLNAGLETKNDEKYFPLDETSDAKASTKRKSSEPPNVEESEATEEPAKPPSNQPEGWFELKVNTHVYVTGLPEDVTVEEVAEVFSKCGIIKEDPENRKLRIKLYSDRDTGRLKGDALVTYLKEPSVDLAIKLLDGTPLRPGEKQLMTVTQAKFEQKGEVFMKKQQNKQKKKKLKQVEQRALGWGGFDDAKKKEPMTVLLRNMFTQQEILSDPSLLPDLEADVAEECSKLGPIERLKVYENSLQGLVMVKFKDREAGFKCIQMMNGRWFGGRQVEAIEDDGLINYARTKDTAEEEARLERFGAELEAD